jgi:hypothetical protein
MGQRRVAPTTRVGNEQQANLDQLPHCAKLQPPLAKRRLLHTTLTKIAVECDRVNRDISTAGAAVDFGK